MVAGVVSIALHGALLFVLFPPQKDRTAEFEPAPMEVSMVGPPLAAAPAAPAPAAAEVAEVEPEQPPAKTLLRPAPWKPPPEVQTIRAVKAPKGEPAPEPPKPAPQLSAAQIAGARTASGGGGGAGVGQGAGGGGGRACDMVAFLERRLRRDARVQAVIAEAHRSGAMSSRAVLVWDGDWIQSSGQDGKGLAGVREALMVEIAFAPESCRTDPVSGLVVIALDDQPGSIRLAMGADRWRWMDLVSRTGRR